MVGFKTIEIETLLMGLLALPTHKVADMPLYIATCLGQMALWALEQNV